MKATELKKVGMEMAQIRMMMDWTEKEGMSRAYTKLDGWYNTRWNSLLDFGGKLAEKKGTLEQHLSTKMVRRAGL